MKFSEQYKGIVGLIILAGLMAIIAIRFDDITKVITIAFNAFVPILIGIVLAFILDILVQKYESIWFSKNSIF